MSKQKRAQSTLEYIIVFTVIVAAILVVANSAIRQKVQSMLNHTANQTEEAVKHINFTN